MKQCLSEKKTTQYLKNNLKYGLVVEEDCK